MAHRIAEDGVGGRATGRSGTPTDGCIGEGVVPVSGLESVVRDAGTSGAALMCRVATGTQGVVGAGGAREYLDEGPAGSSEGLAGGSEPLRSTASSTGVPVSSVGPRRPCSASKGEVFRAARLIDVALGLEL